MIMFRYSFYTGAAGGAGRRRAPHLMQRPPAMPGIPYGLEYLTQVDQLLIHQQVEIFEGLSVFSIIYTRVDENAIRLTASE